MLVFSPSIIFLLTQRLQLRVHYSYLFFLISPFQIPQFPNLIALFIPSLLPRSPVILRFIIRNILLVYILSLAQSSYTLGISEVKRASNVYYYVNKVTRKAPK